MANLVPETRSGLGIDFPRTGERFDLLEDQTLLLPLNWQARQPEIRQAKPILDRIQRIIHRDQPVTFLWESQRLSAVNRRVHDVKPNVLFSLYNLDEWWVDAAR